MYAADGIDSRRAQWCWLAGPAPPCVYMQSIGHVGCCLGQSVSGSSSHHYVTGVLAVCTHKVNDIKVQIEVPTLLSLLPVLHVIIS